jgi:transposase-like protein
MALTVTERWIREFASERGISFSNLRNWVYRFRKESRPLVEAAPA